MGLFSVIVKFKSSKIKLLNAIVTFLEYSYIQLINILLYYISMGLFSVIVKFKSSKIKLLNAIVTFLA